MKVLQKTRLGTQLIFLLLTVVGFWLNFDVALKVIVLSTFIVGVFYCGWLCPYGTMQDLFSKLGKLLKIKKRKMPKRIQKVLKYSRYLISLAVLLSVSDIIFTIISFDPRASFGMVLIGNGAKISSIIVILFFLIISIFFERPFCNYLCAEGAKYGILSSFRIFRIKRDSESCVNCRKCDKVCPMNIDVSTVDSVTSDQCINCLECVSACPIADTLTYGPAKPKFTKKSIGILLILGIMIFSTQIKDQFEEITDSVSGAKAVAKEETAVVETSTEAIKGNYELADGVYTGNGEGFKGTMTVAVTIENSSITDVVVTEHNDDRNWFNRANNVIPSAIVEAQTWDVDVVGGATYSSYGIINGAKDALNE